MQKFVTSATECCERLLSDTDEDTQKLSTLSLRSCLTKILNELTKTSAKPHGHYVQVCLLMIIVVQHVPTNCDSLAFIHRYIQF